MHYPEVLLKRTAFVITVAIVAAALAGGGQMTTADRVASGTWWPTKGNPARAEYVETKACVPCHAALSAVQPSTSMARTAMIAANSTVLRASPRLSFTSGAYRYEIVS